MDWTTLWMIATVVAFLGVISLHLVWREPNHTSQRKG
jgi:hypothetical protein